MNRKNSGKNQATTAAIFVSEPGPIIQKAMILTAETSDRHMATLNQSRMSYFRVCFHAVLCCNLERKCIFLQYWYLFRKKQKIFFVVKMVGKSHII